MELLCLTFVPRSNQFPRHVPVNGTSALARGGEVGETSVLLRQVRGEMGSACAVRESTEFARLHGLDHSVWQRLAAVGCQLWLVNLLIPWGQWPDDEIMSPWSAARVPVFLTCFVVRILTLRTSSRMPERMFGLVVHVSKTLSLGKWQGEPRLSLSLVCNSE